MVELGFKPNLIQTQSLSTEDADCCWLGPPGIRLGNQNADHFLGSGIKGVKRKREGRRENLSFSATLAQLISGDAGMTFKLVTPSHWSHIDMAALLGCHPSCRGLCQQLGKSPSFLKGGLEDITACIPGALYFNDLIWGSFEAGMGAVNNFVLQQPWGPVTCLP